jgi:UDP-N-acetylmuramate dehydrogenase
MQKFQENVSLAALSNYKIGGPAQFFFAPKNEKEVRWAIEEAKAKKSPVFVLGGGTNLLIDDGGWKGLVLRPDILTLKARGNDIEAGAGVLMSDLLNFSIKKSLSGFEWAGGLPGTLGGAIRGNAGCFGGEIKDVVRSVRSFDAKTMKIVDRGARECEFGYRTSIFKKNDGREIILSATLQMRKGEKAAIAKAIEEKIQYRAKNHPLDYPNIGSIFKNVPLVVVHKEWSVKYEEALRDAKLVFRGSNFSVKTDPFPVISAAKLISESGLRGVSFGGAMISAKHPNFIVNVLGAGSPDVKHLITLAKVAVKEKFDVELEEEVQIL